MKIAGMKTLLLGVMALLYAVSAEAATTLLPNGKQCFSATTGINGMVGLLGPITGGSGYVNGVYGNVALTGGSGSGVIANITVSGGAVTSVIVQLPGINYVVGNPLSATAASIGGSGSGFSVGVASIAVNASMAGGQVNMFVPNTTTVKPTWQDSGQVALNTNPIILDSNGCAVIYGTGVYRQQLLDSLGNLVWDQPTADTSASGSVFWAGLSGGTPNAVTVTDPGFTPADGQIIYFLANTTNTTTATLSPSGQGPYQLVKDTAGPVPLSGGEITTGSVVGALFTSGTSQFHLIDYNQSVTTTVVVGPPQGYLGLVGASGNIIQTGDTTSTSVFYTPFVGNQIPVWNGSAFAERTFPELTLTLTGAAHSANGIYDVFIFNNAGTPAIVTGPAWATPTAGAGNRGGGAGTTQILPVNGIYVNQFIIVGTNGASTFNIPAFQATYVGSIYIDTVAGQVTAHRTFGQNRKFGVWNAYNQQTIYLKAGDSTASWGYNTNTIRASNNIPAAWSSTVCNFPTGTACNGLVVFSGLPVQAYDVRVAQSGLLIPDGASAPASQFSRVGIGVNSTTVFSGRQGIAQINLNTSINAGGGGLQWGWHLTGEFEEPPSLGINTIISLETTVTSTHASTLFNGAESSMAISAWWRG